MLKVLAIVPARAGSKRLPQKNIKELGGLPLVAHTFEAIKEAKYISHTLATSDCPKVLEIASSYEQVTPLARPAELASDTASSLDVIKHAVEFAKECEIEFDVICLLQPTTPLRAAEDIDSAIELYIEKNAKGVVSMTECAHSPLWSTRLKEEHDFKQFISGLTNTRAQDLDPYYQLNGAIYLVDKIEFERSGKLFLEQDYYPYIMSNESSIDIDTEIDFLIAATVLKHRADKAC
ncbi:acylneuraminate cytidylyltransferase family protein [Pseudoalteromonas rubra]|uniref:acylneuraminate cytidylyltransferase family protein n=1 Tax=Pseudoalteromonas rubra TaxID=43658 RepID=UPI002DC06490|nr:acylneuraminate cytidylyltransferase family protein [Pseudoalteromonas rubra]MEC4089933.1 acylneuraminate cytidylyltransferase family protein [Pseudoalteromonas rubra]